MDENGGTRKSRYRRLGVPNNGLVPHNANSNNEGLKFGLVFFCHPRALYLARVFGHSWCRL